VFERQNPPPVNSRLESFGDLHCALQAPRFARKLLYGNLLNWTLELAAAAAGLV